MDKGGGWLTPTLLALFLAVFWLTNPQICSTEFDSPTFDETMFITQGIYIAHEADFSLAIQHPPLAKVLISLPIHGLALNVPIRGAMMGLLEEDREDPIVSNYVENYPPDQLVRNPYYIGYHLLYDYNRFDAKEIFLRCRRVVQLMHLFLILLVYAAARRLFGANAAIIAAAIAFFDPNLFAHGRLCTTDMAATLYTFAAFYGLLVMIDSERTPGRIEKFKWASGGSWIIAAGLMCVTKYSCLIFLPVFVVVFLWRYWHSIYPAFTYLVIGGAVTLGVCYMVGGFSFEPYVIAYKQLGVSLGKGRPSYLLGNYSDTGFAFYYFATLIFKMPLGLLMMLLAGIVAAIWHCRWRALTIGEITMWLVPALFLISTIIFHRNNLGLRHILVIYPFLILIGVSIIPRLPRFSRMTLVGLILTALFLIETVPAMRDPIPFFNWPSRKAAYEGKLLADSNIDWGQDLGRLADFCVKNDIKHLRLRYFGTADPSYHLGDIPGFTLDIMGPEYNNEPGPEGWYAVSLQKVLAVRGRAKNPGGVVKPLEWLLETEPYARIGGSMFVYRYSPPGS